ncbi:MAG: nucleotidyl transferase AbiEii/AbiGii toxin family protein [Bacteroidales bacterium]|nr:nucleotidyl transferase AbiEii/AbiGii toxin family protein [Bacteroidales bacterium]
MLHLETIEPKTLELLRRLQSLPIFEHSRLVGGTALALQLGHRKSIDLDLFGTIEASPEDIQEVCRKVGKLEISKKSRNINIYWIDGIKVDCVNYPYEWLDECRILDGIRLASVNDIAAMKISAIINRGTKKDFIDLYFLLQEMSLNHILDLYDQKYPDGSRFIAIKSLTYFEDAEADPMPFMLNDITWEKVKSSIIAEVRKL